MSQPSALLEEARKHAVAQNIEVAESKYKQIILSKEDESTTKKLQEQEASILELGKIYQKSAEAVKLNDLITESRAILGNFAKSKTAKIVKTLMTFSTPFQTH